MPDFTLGGVGVKVGPDFTGFTQEADRRLEVIERELKPVEVKLVADLMAGFRKEAEAKAKEALAGVAVKIDLEPNIRGFKTETERLVKETAAQVNAEIRVTPKLSKDFKAELRAEVDKATKGTAGEVELRPSLAAGFQKELRAEIQKATKGIKAKVEIAPSLTSTFRSELKALVKEASANAVSVNVTVDPENVEDIRRKLRAAVTEAAQGLRVRVEVIPEVGSFRARLRAETGKLSVGSRPKVAVGADTLPFVRELKATIAAAKTYAVVPVKLAVSGARAGLGGIKSVLDGTLKVVRNLAIGVGLLGVAIAGVGAVGIKSAGEFEIQRKALQILLQDVDKGTELFKGLQKQAKFTPFEIQDLTPIAKQFVVIRNTLGDKNFSLDRILPSTQAVTDLGAALGVTGPQIQKVGLALGKIAGRGKLTSEELRSISKNLPGFSAIKAVADGLGIDVPEAFKKVREGAIDSKTAIDLILKGMKEFPGAAGAAAKQATETFRGALTNLPDVLRISFFESFDKYLPRLTKIIGPEGPLVKALEATLPAIAAAFTPLAENLLTSVQQLGPAAAALVTSFLPLLVSVVKAVGTLGPALERGFLMLAPTLETVGHTLERLADVVTVVLYGAFSGLSGPLADLTDSLVNFLGYVGQIVVIASPLLPLFVEIASTLVGTVGKTAVPVAQAFAAAFEEIAPVVVDVIRTLGIFVTKASPLIVVLGKIIAMIGEGLVKAVRGADLDALAEALGELAIAAAQIVVAFLPLIPVIAEIATILASELVPLLEVLAPIIRVTVTALSPFLIVLARLAPLLATVFAVAKVYQWGKAMTDTVTTVLAQLGPLGTKLFDKLTDVDWAGVGKKVVAGAAVATAGMSGVFLGAAEDSTTALTSIASAGASIATAFATGGPIMGTLSIAATAIGYFFGQAQKRAKQASEAQRLYNADVKDLRTAFENAGVDRYSSQSAKALVVTKDLLDKLRSGSKETIPLRTAFNNLGVDFERVAASAALGKDGVASLKNEIKEAAEVKADWITSQELRGISDFGRLSGEAADAVNKVAQNIGLLKRGSSGDVGLWRPMDGEFKTLAGLRNYIKLTFDGTEETKKLAEAERMFKEQLKANLMDSPAAQYIEQLPAKTRAALREQSRLAEVQKLITDEENRNRGSAIKFAEAYDKVNDSVSKATGAYSKWVQGLQGAKVPLAEVKLGILDYAKQLLEVRNNPDLKPFEKQNQDLKLVAAAQDEATNALGRFVEESGGNYDTFRNKVNVLSLELTQGLAESLGISQEEAKKLVDQILLIPSAGEFGQLAGITANITGMDDLQGRVTTFITSDIRNSVYLDATDPTKKSAVIDAWITQYVASDPKAKAYLDTLDPQEKAQLIANILKGIDGKTATSTVYLDVIERRYQEGIDSGAIAQQQKLLGKPRVANAAGSVVRAPVVSLVGEAGPEVILPLTDPARMAELLRQVGVSADLARLTAGMAAGQPAAPPADAGGGTVASASGAGTTVSWTVNNEGLDEWAKATVAIFTDTTAQIVAILTKWQTDTQFIVDTTGRSTVANMATWESQAVAGFAAMIGALTSMATAGGASVVESLRASLAEGSSVVNTVVHDYAVQLAGALNPILTATGAKTLDVKAFREGGVAEATPRIAPDGSYQVHVFGERGTHGEAYIPFDPSLRSNSRAIADETVRRLGGRAQWFREGGVTGDTVGLNPAFLTRLGMWSGAVGQTYTVNDGYRSPAESDRLYADYIAGRRKAPAAPGGRSMHNFGLASDGNRWRGKHPELFGLRFPMDYEPWHVEPVEARAWAKGMAPDGGSIPGLVPFPTVPVVPDRGELRRAALAAMEYVRNVALDWATKQSFSTGISGIGDLTSAGVPVEIARALATIRAMESGGNYTARNPSSSASGAYQFLASTWANYGGYPAAWLAPKSVQDAKAMANVLAILAKYGGVLEAIPAAWYTGSYRGHGHLDYNPGGKGNRLSVQEYVNRWLAKYASVPGYENGGLTLREQMVRVSERNKPELILPLTRPSRVRELADQHGLTEFLMERERRRSDRPNLNVTLTPPAAERPETYAASLRNRLAPLLT